MRLTEQIEKAKEGIRQGIFSSEAAVCQGLLLPILHGLDWPVFNTSIVIPQFSVGGRRVDYALCHHANKVLVLIEVKKIGSSDGADRQLFEYAFHDGVPMAILTDGQEWSFYLPGEPGKYDERRVYKLDLLERKTEESYSILERYLSYKRICSGEALKAARSDYQNVARDREIASVIPKAWYALLENQDSLLLDLLAEKVEDICGYKPEIDVCSQFIESLSSQTIDENSVIRRTTQITPYPAPKKKSAKSKQKFSFIFKGNKYEARSARDVMTKLFQLLAKEDVGFLERFVSRKHGKKRRYVSRNKSELYRDRPDLANEHSVEIVPGWWMGTNYSRNNIQKIIDLACEVAEPKLASTITAQVELNKVI